MAVAGRNGAPNSQVREPRRLARRLDQEKVRQILADYTAGTKPIQELAAQHGLSKGGLRNLRLQNDVPSNRKPLTDEQRQRARNRYASGLSVAAIATELNSSYSAVRRALIAAGMEMRPRGGSSGRRTPPPSVSRADVGTLEDTDLPGLEPVKYEH